ncbi:MAG: tRNA pseudouridine(38-40) synthase TruA [Promethearchaeota archaeon]
MSPRFALRAFYLGERFHGSQVQPDVPTVEGSLLEVLEQRGYVNSATESNFRGASRTDAGVSALGNVFSFVSERKPIISEINAHLPADLRCWALARVADDFNPRGAVRRTYRYFYDAHGLEVDEETLLAACGLLVGTHDFRNFAKHNPTRPPVRRLESATFRRGEHTLVFEFVGGSFLWKQVRKMVTALVMAGRGKLTLEEFASYLDPATKVDLSPAPPANLVLWNVEYDPPAGFVPDPAGLRAVKRIVHRHWAEHRVAVDLFGELASTRLR